MIGAKGLLGKSWPDLDMLPLGWLTDPGDENSHIVVLFHFILLSKFCSEKDATK